MWYGNPYSEKGWWGKDGGWYTSGWAEYWPYWTSRPLFRGPRVVERHSLPMAYGPWDWTMIQTSAFHGAIPPQGFPPAGYQFSS